MTVSTTEADIERLVELIYSHRGIGLPPDALADIYDRLIWCLDDEGTTILRMRENWLMGDDRGRVEVALAMNETFPFSDSNMMDEVFARIRSKWPDLSAQCENIKKARGSI